MSEPGASDAARTRDRAAVFEVLPTPYVVLTPELLIADMNAAYLAVTGRSRDELVGRYFLAAFPPPAESLDADGRSELQVSLERVRDTGRPDTLPVQKYPIAGPDGVMTERHWAAVHVPVLDAAGRVRFVVQRTEDITEFSRERERVAALAENADDGGWRARAERVEADLFVRARELADAVAAKDEAARQVASLAEASLALASAATLEEVEHIVVGRGLPVLGSDGGGIVSPDESGEWRITVNESLGEDVQTRYPDAPYDSMIPGCWCARTGQRLLLPTRESGLAFEPDVMAGIYEATERSGWAFVPLVAGDRRLGSLAVSWVQEHELAADELDLLDGFAAQCAQALLRVETEQAQQAAALEVQQLAHALQQALLTPPPEPDHLHLVTRYRPAGHHAQVGGDWYDAFLQPDGATMLVIGDVVGHDSAAAAKMGQLRGVLRTLAYDAERSAAPDTPSAILSRLELVTRGLAVNTMATAVLARIEQPDTHAGGTRVMRWSNAGHPPPVLVHADGRVEILDTEPDLLLGVDPGAARHDHTIEVPDEATLLFYTDGLIERRDPDQEVSPAALQNVLSGLAGHDVDELCDLLLARLVPDEGDDDIALIAVRAHSELGPRPASAGAQRVPDLPAESQDRDERWAPGDGDARIDLPFSAEAAALARQFVRAHTSGLSGSLREDAELLVSELATNAIRYGRPGVTLSVQVADHVLRVSVTDHGPEVPVQPVDTPGPRAASGRGLLIVASIAADWHVSQDGTSKTVAFEVREPS